MDPPDVKQRAESIKLTNLGNENVNDTGRRPSKGVYVPDVEVQNQDLQGMLASPTLDVSALQKWNSPRGNIARFGASFYSIFVFGLSDAAYGALLPYVRQVCLCDDMKC